MQEMADEVQVVNGPIPPAQQGTVIYSITLQNGYPITNPAGFDGTQKTDDRQTQVRPLR